MNVVVKIRRGRIFTWVYRRYWVTMNLPSRAKKMSSRVKVRMGNSRQTSQRLSSIIFALYSKNCNHSVTSCAFFTE